MEKCSFGSYPNDVNYYNSIRLHLSFIVIQLYVKKTEGILQKKFHKRILYYTANSKMYTVQQNFLQNRKINFLYKYSKL